MSQVEEPSGDRASEAGSQIEAISAWWQDTAETLRERLSLSIGKIRDAVAHWLALHKRQLLTRIEPIVEAIAAFIDELKERAPARLFLGNVTQVTLDDDMQFKVVEVQGTVPAANGKADGALSLVRLTPFSLQDEFVVFALVEQSSPRQGQVFGPERYAQGRETTPASAMSVLHTGIADVGTVFVVGLDSEGRLAVIVPNPRERIAPVGPKIPREG